jgi:hypothetical protein
VGNWDDADKVWARRDRPNRGPCCPEKYSWNNLFPWWGRGGGSMYFERVDKEFI